MYHHSSIKPVIVHLRGSDRDITDVTWKSLCFGTAHLIWDHLSTNAVNISRYDSILYDVDSSKSHTVQLPETIPVRSHQRAVCIFGSSAWPAALTSTSRIGTAASSRFRSALDDATRWKPHFLL
ncbi:uncharacterized protein LOC132923425 [Rhopalosiphum padi]|uniref:uncharacterized protein LOC132923425 n=1 Tax=Rhopalosiphum padi TaxID=40932 RepID=UPI00298E941E|nr:uncharacterized protein LOC132923425 [Rhopalosiphum padi]